MFGLAEVAEGKFLKEKKMEARRRDGAEQPRIAQTVSRPTEEAA
jgi:hypothetical protein